jgi:hypothetical protein
MFKLLDALDQFVETFRRAGVPMVVTDTRF